MVQRTKKPTEENSIQKPTEEKVKKERKELTPEQKEAKAKKKAEKKARKEKEAAKLKQPPKTHVSNKQKKESVTKFNQEAEGKVWFRKVGRGSLRGIPGCTPIIKPNEKFLAYPDSIPVSFRNSIVRVDQEGKKPVEETQTADMAYRIKKLKGGLFNVVNKKAKRMNTTPLSREEAVKLRNDLND